MKIPFISFSIGIVLALSGCGGISLNRDYYDYTDVYGKSINKQLLLNLARLSRDEPPYFLQLSGFSAQHTLTGSLGLGNKSMNIGKSAGVTELDGTASVGGTEQPIFQFVPLNGDPFGQAFTTPLNGKIFYTFYDQNVPADMLARMMLQSVDVTIAKDFDDPSTFRVKRLVNDPLDPTYRDFLVWCYIMRTYQLEHELTVKVDKPYERAKIHKFSNISISDYEKAIDYNLDVTNDSSTTEKDETIKYTLYPQTTGTVTIKPDVPVETDTTTDTAKPNYVTDVCVDEPRFIATNLTNGPIPNRDDPTFSFIVEHPKKTDVHKDMTSRAIVLESLGASTKYPKINRDKLLLNMRTFFSVMQSMAKEQLLYAAAAKRQIAQSSNDGYHKTLWPSPADRNGRSISACPLIILRGDVASGSGTHEEVLTAINYGGEDYKIADQVDENNMMVEDADLVSSNRQAFGLLSYLFTQISIDPKKLPVQQLIQVQ